MSETERPEVHPRHARLAQQIVDGAAANAWPAGTHMREEELAGLLGVSRTPVRSALRLLARLGIVGASSSRGFVLLQAGDQLAGTSVGVPRVAEEKLRDALIRDRLAKRIPVEQPQVALARHYGVSRLVLQRVIRRMEQEGLVVRKGWRWSFVPTIEDRQSREASYEIRLMIEPQALLLPGFRPDPRVLRQLVEAHRSILAVSNGQTHPGSEIFALDAKFHDTLAKFSGNPFVENIIRQQNALRRLFELAGYGDRRRIVAWCREHLDILRLLGAGDVERASQSLRKHLMNARKAAERSMP